MKKYMKKKTWSITKKYSNSKWLDIVLWSTILVIITITIIVNFYYSECKKLSYALYIFDFIVMSTMLKFTKKGTKLCEQIVQSKNEAKKVIWPTKRDTINTTLIIVAIIIVTAIIIYFIDLLFMYFINIILRINI